MYRKVHIGNYQFYFGVSKLQWVHGVCSNLRDGNHILMWDFDEMPWRDAMVTLLNVQNRYDLPTIHLLQSSPPENWIAYCFKRLPWQRAFSIVASTEGVDWQFVKHSCARNYFTLRIGRKRGVEPKIFHVLKGRMDCDCGIDELSRFVKYQTRADKQVAIGKVEDNGRA